MPTNYPDWETEIMSNEIQISYQSGKTVYGLIFNAVGLVYNTGTQLFESYLTANYGNYTVSLTQLGVTSPFYEGTFPSAIPAGEYSVAGKNQTGGSPAESDITIAIGTIEWGTGGVVVPRSALATSGQIAQNSPIKVYRGEMVVNFPLKLVSASDHVTSFTSGIVSGQISRDGAIFGPLQSGNISEMGLGWYQTTLTSGDLLANTVALSFRAVGVSGGQSDQRDFSFLLQRSSVSGSF